MRTVYIYLSVAGWIWFVIAGCFLIWKMRSRQGNDSPVNPPVVDVSTEAEQPNE
jgi:hypothetical protein